MVIRIADLDTFTRAYIDSALWSSTDEDGEPLDGLYSADDVHDDTLARMVGDCREFQTAHADDIGDRAERAGHDYWLTRNRHGAGFWDGDWESGAAKRLTVAAHADGSFELYVGDDGYIHAV